MRVENGYETTTLVRHLVFAIALTMLVLPTPGMAQPASSPTASPAPNPVILRLRAKRVAFYYDRYLVEADGGVRIQAGNGMTLSGDAFSMDLRLNRFLIAGHVRLHSATGDIEGAAIADFLDFDRIYFVPVIGKPDRWTYEHGDFGKPLKGREMPGDTFYFPDLGVTHPTLVAKNAVIRSKTFVRFGGVTANLLNAGIPLQTYYVYFGTGQDLAQNSLSGANFDGTWNLFGNANSITSLHARYDQFNRAYLGFEQHFAGNDPHEYAVFSVSPFTKDDRYWNLVTGEHIGSKFQIDTFSQLYTDSRPDARASALTTYVTLTQAFAHSYVQSFTNFTNYDLIGDEAPNVSPNHPVQSSLSWYSTNNRVYKTPFYEQTRVGWQYNHDAYGLQDYGNTLYTSIWAPYVGVTLSMPNVKIGDRDKPYGMYYLNASTDSMRQWFNVPHRVNTQNTTISLSRQFSHVFNAYLAYNEQNTSDLYLTGGYAAPILPPGYPNPLADFTGASSLRITSLGMTYSASPNLVASLTTAHHQDFPGPYPDYYPVSPLNPLGQYTYNNYLGQPPWAMTGEVRARLLPHLVLDVQRTYFFHYGTQIWSPSFVVQFSQ